MYFIGEMEALIVIPARYNSRRLPGKPLKMIGDKPLIQHCWEKAMKSKRASNCIIATDDDRIATACEDFGASVVMTDPSHESGTARCAEVASRHPGHPVVINLQGDEPFMDPLLVDAVIEAVSSGHWDVVTPCTRAREHRELFDPAKVKVVSDRNHRALYFSRAAIPHMRDLDIAEWMAIGKFYLHIGIYGFRFPVLQELTGLPESPLEKAEKLEQLRWLENAYNIGLVESNYRAFGVDTPEDLQRARQMWNRRGRPD